MENIYDKYEPVIGLEVHAQLLTRSKNFSSDRNEYGAIPNTNISVISLGHPGTLPMLNKKTIEYAVRIGLACNCNITREMYFSRKNYFYPDLPKGYQITQDNTPVCRNGFVQIKDDNNNDKVINLTRIHIEEDSGKSIHDVDPYHSLVDLNRAGVPLLEIVSEPEIRSGREAYNYMTEIRKLVRYLEICDGNLEEGSMRCDANISVRLKGEVEFGVKVEVKNMNSMRNVQRAIEYEIKRQIEAIEKGETIYQETRNFDAVNGITLSMRSKEMAHDYRYFPEPDLQPVFISQEYIDEIHKSLPPLPLELFNKYISKLGLTEYDAYQLTDNKAVALYFEELIKHTGNYKAAANWLMGSVRYWLKENGIEIEDFPLPPSAIASLIEMIDKSLISNTAASQEIFPEMLANPDKTAGQIAQEKNLLQESNSGALKEFVVQAIQNIGMQKVIEYKKGKESLVGLFMGEVMKLSKGKADPKVARQILVETLAETEVEL